MSVVNVVPLDAYFERIGWGETPRVDVETLHAVAAHHCDAIPFENLDVLMGRGIDLAPEAVAAKLITTKRGGYCLEQNQLLLDVLVALGFHARPVSGRVRWQRPRAFIPPRSHLFVLVDLGNSTWVVDVGVGSSSLGGAVLLEEGRIQATPHDARRFVREDGMWFHQISFDDESWHDVVEFTGEAMPPIDREVANHWTSTHPASKFRQNLLVARTLTTGERVSLSNAEWTWRTNGAAPKRRVLTSRAELVDRLACDFGLTFAPDTPLVFPFPLSN